MTSKKEHALALAARGFRVFPLAINGKVPANEGNWRKNATTDPARIREMWTCPVMGDDIDYNIGAALDAGMMVLDVDTRDGKQGDKSLATLEMIYDALPVTLVVRTASGGEHHVLSSDLPVANSASKIGQHLDVKGFGGYFVAPGSTIDGKTYTIINDAPVAPAPSWLVQLAGAPRERSAGSADATQPACDLDSESAIRRATSWLETRAPEAGTYAVAAKVKDFGVSRDKCLDLVMEHWPPAEAKGEEHVAFRVDNAYRYGQNAPGVASAEAEFDSVEVDKDAPARPKKGLAFRNIAEFKWSTDQGGYLVQGFMKRGMLAMMSAPSNAGKSPLALDLAAHIAMGKPWREMKIKQPHYVLHYSTEGFTGLGNRMEAIRREHFAEVAGAPFDFISGSLDMRTSTNDTKAIIATVNERAAVFGVPAGLVVIDTLSHALGGGDESNPEHMRALLRNCAAITAKTGAAVMLLHHPPKDASTDYRGSSILLNDIDLMVKVETDAKTKRRTVTTPRVKEFAEIDPMQFNIKVVRLGEDEDGDAITSVVVDWINQAEVEFEIELTPAQREVFDALDNLMKAKRMDENAINKTSATFTEWSERLELDRSNKGKDRGAKQALTRHLPVLLQNGVVVKTQEDQYLIPAKWNAGPVGPV